MIALKNGCSCSNPSVYPKNWKTVSASTQNDWRIQYYFRDPKFAGRYPSGKLVVIKGMNRFKFVVERREITKMLLSEELQTLQHGYNPIIDVVMDNDNDTNVTPKTGFITALQLLRRLVLLAVSRMCVPAFFGGP